MQYKTGFVVLSACAAIFLFGRTAAAEEVMPMSGPPLLSDRPLPPPRATVDIPPSPALTAAPAPESEPYAPASPSPEPAAKRRYAPFRDHRSFPEKNGGGKKYMVAENDDGNASVPVEADPDKASPKSSGKTIAQADAKSVDKSVDKATASESDRRTTEEEAPAAAPEPPPLPPTPESVELYRQKLEDRLLERYNNLPATAGKVAKVQIVLTRPLEVSVDGRFIKAEFDQLVYDIWGKRLPALEKEYYVVTFGSGGVAQVRSDPSIRVGLDLEKTYSERAPLAADPFRNVKDYDEFKNAPPKKMPGWWRPDFPELR